VSPRKPSKPIRSQAKYSRIRSQKEKHQTQYNNAIEKLKGCGQGKFLIMVACGPSILEVDFDKIKDHPYIDMMSINKPDPRIHPTKYWVFCDNSQYVRNKDLFPERDSINITKQVSNLVKKCNKNLVAPIISTF